MSSKNFACCMSVMAAAGLLYGSFEGMFSGAQNSLVFDEAYRHIVSIEVTRHGERDPGDLFGFAEPEFDGDEKNLTYKGAKTQYDLGQKIRFRADMFGISEPFYSANQVYTMSTYKDRAYDSALAQLMGAYDVPFEFPLPSAESLGFDIRRPADTFSDWILRNDDDTCKRVAQLEESIEEAPSTISYFQMTNAYLEQDFYPQMREKVGMPEADTETIEDVVNYIDWAIRSDMKLNVDISKEERKLISMADEAGIYEDQAAGFEAYMLGTWQLQQLYIEVSEILLGTLRMQDAKILTQYFPQAASANAEMPSWISFAGHASNIKPLNGLFNNNMMINPPPSSSIWVSYYECETCEDDKRIMTEVSYCCGAENDYTCKKLAYNELTDGTSSARDFIAWLSSNLDMYTGQHDMPSQDIEDICEVDYVYNPELNAYVDPNIFYNKWLAEFDAL